MRTLRAVNVLSALSVTGLLLASAPAHAQQSAESKAREAEFSVQRFETALGPRNYNSVERDRSDGKIDFSAGIICNYASKPFVVQSCISQTYCDQPNAANTTDVNVIKGPYTF